MRKRLRLSFHAQAALLAGTFGAVAIAAGPGFGCAGTGHGGVGGGDEGGGSGSSTTGPAAPSSVLGMNIFSKTCTPGQPSVDWSPMRRISRLEYDDMVRDLLGDTTSPATGFPPESPMFDGVNLQVNTYAGVSTTIIEQYLQAAESLAESAVGDTNRMNNVILAGIASCGQAHDDTCAKDFIASWANRAYRGQLDATEASGLFDVYSTVKAQFDWTTGIQAIITAVLESPRFLYVMEFGDGSPTGNVVPLSSYETAARLALFLWRSVPDTTLMNDAAQGKLATAAQVLAEAQRMLTGANQAKAQVAVQDFANQWLQLTGIQAKDAQFQNSFNAHTTLPAAMYDEARLDVSQAVLADDGTFTDLLTSPASYINQDLASFYNVGMGSSPSVTVSDGAAGGQTFVKTTLPNRAGVLTNAGVLATQAHSTLPSFVLRGKLVRENVLCDPIPPPPPGIPAPPTMAPDAGSTTRNLLLAHQQKGTTCPTCHQYMDSIGEGFGNFDATGQYQSTDANGFTPASSFLPIDASGKVVGFAGDPPGADLQTTYTNAVDLVTKLAGSTQAQECFALQELRYATGRLESASDACSVQEVYQAFTSSKLNIQQLMLAIVQSDAFRYRSVETAGSACQ